eukprot:COSAG06_NODE_54135_length_296_cov_0.781726_1_plen_64_part_01
MQSRVVRMYATYLVNLCLSSSVQTCEDVLQALERGRGLILHPESAVRSMQRGVQMETMGQLRLF